MLAKVQEINRKLPSKTENLTDLLIVPSQPLSKSRQIWTLTWLFTITTQAHQTKSPNAVTSALIYTVKLQMGQLKALKRPTYLSVQSKQKDSASLMNLAALKMINNP